MHSTIRLHGQAPSRIDVCGPHCFIARPTVEDWTEPALRNGIGFTNPEHVLGSRNALSLRCCAPYTHRAPSPTIDFAPVRMLSGDCMLL